VIVKLNADLAVPLATFYARYCPIQQLSTRGRRLMQDFLYVMVTIVFFAVAIAYVHFCERVK
jgi:hypothetical protein